LDSQAARWLTQILKHFEAHPEAADFDVPEDHWRPQLDEAQARYQWPQRRPRDVPACLWRTNDGMCPGQTRTCHQDVSESPSRHSVGLDGKGQLLPVGRSTNFTSRLLEAGAGHFSVPDLETVLASLALKNLKHQPDAGIAKFPFRAMTNVTQCF
jgi:hypothetical protein